MTRGHRQHRRPAPGKPASDRSDRAWAGVGRQPFAEVHIQANAARLDQARQGGQGRLAAAALVDGHDALLHAGPRSHLPLRQPGRAPGLAQERTGGRVRSPHRAEDGGSSIAAAHRT